MAVLSSTGVLAVTKARLLVLASLALTWWLARLAPQYRPLVQAEVSSRIHEAARRIPNIRLNWRPAGEAPGPFNASKLALLIEPRPLPHLVPLMVHMVAVAPPDWRFLFIGSQRSIHSVARAPAVQHHQAAGKMAVRGLPQPWSIDSPEHVFRLLTDVRFYDEFLPGVEWILKYEHDSILCANSPQSLDDWLDWSWAGAPQYGARRAAGDWLTASRSDDDRFSGTGGLSLRRVSAIKRVLGFQRRHNDSEPEDEWFGKRLAVMPGEKVAPRVQGAFAVENVLVDKPMGYHIRAGGTQLKPEVWDEPETRKKVFEYCPELSIIMAMKLERERCPDDDKRGGRKADDDKHDGSKADDDLSKLEVHIKTEPQGEAGAPILPPQPPQPPQPHEAA